MKLLDNLMAVNVDDYPEDKITYDQTPIRMFKSDALEMFTHVTPQAILIIWLPVVAVFLYLGIATWPVTQSPVWMPLIFALGFILVWTFSEYVIHRFVFHLPPKTRTAAQIVFLFHHIHHVQPHIKTRLVMPPAVSIPMAFVAFGLFSLIFNNLIGAPHLLMPILAGFTLGYVCYDMVHYATHHSRTRNAIMKFLKRHHMEHHYKTPHARFGVTSNVWDLVFNTEPPVSGPLPADAR